MPEPSVNRTIGQPFIVLDSVDSTNNYALSRLHAGMAQHGLAILALEQYAGKGQRGKKWTAEKGDGLILSVVLNPQPLQLRQQFELSAAVALAARDLLSIYTAGDVFIKWPNDLYWQDRKAGGVLIENIIGSPAGNGQAAWKWAVAGIGLNLNQPAFPPELSNPVSLRQITGKKHDPEELARELCDYMDKRFKQLQEGEGVLLLQEYNEYLYRIDQVTRFRKGTKVFEAKVKRVLASGELEIQHGVTEQVRHGELEWIIP